MTTTFETYSRKGPNASLRYALGAQEKPDLAALYNEDGAWTHEEAVRVLGESRLAVLLAERIIGMQHTEMGRMYQLLARGRISVFHTADAALSLVAQLDRAYLRLVFQERGWALEIPDTSVNPHYQGLDKLFPRLGLKEVNTNGQYPRALVGGKLSGGGHGTESLTHIATTTKADALYRRIDIIIFTPSPRRGQVRAEQHRSVMTLIHALPRTEDTTRWTRIPRPLAAHPHGNTPALLPHQAVTYQGYADPLPERTLALLQQPRSVRTAQAQADLDVDGVISTHQLRRYYGLEPVDLSGRLLTVALMRPIRSRSALEVQQTLVVSGSEMAAKDDNELNHRLTLAEMRHSLGIAASPQVWQVDPRTVLKLNQPDAVWTQPSGRRVAVEADTGQYSTRTVEQKIDSFGQQGYAQTLWGAASKQRARNIERRVAGKYPVAFTHPTWWVR